MIASLESFPSFQPPRKRRLTSDAAHAFAFDPGDDVPLLPPYDGPGDDDGDDDDNDGEPVAPNWASFFAFARLWYVHVNGNFWTCSPEEIEDSILHNRLEARRFARRFGRLLASLRGDQDVATFAAVCGRTAEKTNLVESGKTLAAGRLAHCLLEIYGGPPLFVPQAGAASDSARAQAMGAAFRDARGKAGLDAEVASVMAAVSPRALLAIESGWLLRGLVVAQDVLWACRSQIPGAGGDNAESRIQDFVMSACSS